MRDASVAREDIWTELILQNSMKEKSVGVNCDFLRVLKSLKVFTVSLLGFLCYKHSEASELLLSISMGLRCLNPKPWLILVCSRQQHRDETIIPLAKP